MLLAEGASVGLFDVIPQEKGDSIAKELSADGKALYVKVDITDDQAVKAAVQQVVDKFGNLKGCVHCAGIALKRDWTNDASESIPNFRKVRDLDRHQKCEADYRWSMSTSLVHSLSTPMSPMPSINPSTTLMGPTSTHHSGHQMRSEVSLSTSLLPLPRTMLVVSLMDLLRLLPLVSLDVSLEAQSVHQLTR